MRKLLIFAFLFLAWASPGFAQGRYTPATLTASDPGTCSATNAGCLVIPLSGGSSASVAFVVSANASGNTIQFEGTVDGSTWAAVNAYPLDSSTPATSTTGTETWTASVPGLSLFRLRISTLVSGSATVGARNTTATSTSSRSGAGGGTPASPLNSLQYNNAGAFGGVAISSYTPSTLTFTAENPLDLCDITSGPDCLNITGASGTFSFTGAFPSSAPAYSYFAMSPNLFLIGLADSSGGGDGYYFNTLSFYPSNTGAQSLGNSTLKWLDLFLAPASSASYGHFSLPASFTAPRTITWADANVVLPQGGFLGSTKCVDGIDPATGILSSHVCAPISGYVSCTQATPCAAAGTTIYTVGASDSQIQIHANTSCTTTVAGATAILTLKYVDPSGTTQTITEPTATCTALGASSVASVTTTVRAQAASAVQYSVAIANAPHYETSVAVELEGN